MARVRERVTKARFKIESTSGVDAAPTGADFLRIITGSNFAYNPTIIANTEFRGGPGEGEHVVAGLLPTVSLKTNIRGSGTPNVPPETDALLQACGFVETIEAALPVAGGTTATTGTSRSVTVVRGTDWPAAGGFASGLIGEQVVLGGNPAIAEVDVITDYVVAGANATITVAGTHSPAFDNATTIQRLVQVVFRSQSPTPQPSGTSYLDLDGVLQKLLGCRGTWSEDWAGRGIGTMQFDLSGAWGGRTASAMLTGETDDPSSPQPWMNGICRIDGLTICADAMRAALNATGDYPTCPEALYGVDGYEVTGRGSRLTVDPDLDNGLVGTADRVSALLNGTIMPAAFILGSRLGSATGKRHSLCLPQGKLRGVTPTVVGGRRKEQIEFGSKDVDNEWVLSFS